MIFFWLGCLIFDLNFWNIISEFEGFNIWYEMMNMIFFSDFEIFNIWFNCCGV